MAEEAKNDRMNELNVSNVPFHRYAVVFVCATQRDLVHIKLCTRRCVGGGGGRPRSHHHRSIVIFTNLQSVLDVLCGIKTEHIVTFGGHITALLQ